MKVMHKRPMTKPTEICAEKNEPKMNKKDLFFGDEEWSHGVKLAVGDFSFFGELEWHGPKKITNCIYKQNQVW